MPNPTMFKSHQEYLDWYREYRKKNRNKMRKYNKKYNREWRKKKSDSENMKFYFTFGFGQRYENCFTVIIAKTYGEAREIMVDKFGLKWAFQYTEKQWKLENGKTQQEEYNLREIK